MISRKWSFSFKFVNNIPNLNWLAIKNLIENGSNIDFDNQLFKLTIETLSKAKTHPQLGYLYAEMIPKIIKGYRDAGYDVPYGKYGEEWVKNQIKTLPEIMFIEEIGNVITKKKEVVLRSFASATKEEMSRVIDICIRVYGEYLGITFEKPKK